MNLDDYSLETVYRLWQAYCQDMVNTEKHQPTKDMIEFGDALGEYLFSRQPTMPELKREIKKYFEKHHGEIVYADELAPILGVSDIGKVMKALNELDREGKIRKEHSYGNEM